MTWDRQHQRTCAVVFFVALVIVALALFFGAQGCGPNPSVRFEGIAGEGDVTATVAIGQGDRPTYVSLRVVAGAEYGARAGLMGFARGCFLLQGAEISCQEFAAECRRDPVTNFCTVPAPEEAVEP